MTLRARAAKTANHTPEQLAFQHALTRTVTRPLSRPAPPDPKQDIDEGARKKCIELTLEALTLHKVEKDQSMYVKKALEAWNGALWMVVIGTAFGASVAHEKHGLLMFCVGRVHCLCFMSFNEGDLINGKKEGEGGAPGGGGGGGEGGDGEKQDEEGKGEE